MQMTCHPRLGGALEEGGGHRNICLPCFCIIRLIEEWHQ